MLVLSRRVGERLVIGDDIVVTVIEVRSDGVRLGIDAPRSVAVHRAEVLEAVTAANVAATTADDDEAAESLRSLLAPRSDGAQSDDPQTGSDRADEPQADAVQTADHPQAGADPAEAAPTADPQRSTENRRPPGGDSRRPAAPRPGPRPPRR
jgi:carbon storage regulator